MKIKKIFGLGYKPTIVPFIGFGNNNKAILFGIVKEDKGIAKPKRKHSFWKNMRQMLKRYSSSVIENTKVKIEFLGKEAEVVTNEYGIFRCELELDKTTIEHNKIWHTAHYKLLNEENSNEVTGQVMLISNQVDYGVISDVDDTFLVSHSTQTLKKLRLMIFRNAVTRIPFKGIAGFFNALNQRENSQNLNPMFFVSSSEWNLYDLLYDFSLFHNIPKGVYLLKDSKLTLLNLWKSGKGLHEHKIEKIEFLLTFYNNLKFILIGDSGQKDPENYLRIVKKFPNRILAIYIRKIGTKKRLKRLSGLVKEADANNTEMLIVQDTREAAVHAIKNKYITAKHYNAIVNEINEENKSSNLIEIV